MRIYNPQNQFGKDLVTKELVSEKLGLITGFNLDTASMPKGTLQAQIDALKTGKLSYVILTKAQWDAKKDDLKEEDVNTVYLVPESSAKEGSDNIYTEYLVYKTTDTEPVIKYEKIGEIGGDVSELVSRITALETNGVQSVSAATDETGVTANAIEVATVTSTDDTKPVKKVTIKVKKATTTTYGVVKISAALPDTNPSTEVVVTEKVLADVKTALEKEIDDLAKGTTVAVGQVLTTSVTVGTAEGAGGTSGTFTITPKEGVSKVKILAVEDNTGEQWSYKLSTATADNGKVFQVWNEGEYDTMASSTPSTAPTSLTVSYAVVELTTPSAS